MSYLSASKANTSPSARFPLSTRAVPICRVPHKHSASRIHSHAGLAAGPLALLAFRPWFPRQRRSPPWRSRSLLPYFWVSGSGGALSPRSPAGSRPAGRLHGPVVSPQVLLLLPSSSLALRPPSASRLPLLGSSPVGGRLGSPPPPLKPLAPAGMVQRLSPLLFLVAPLAHLPGAFPAGPFSPQALVPLGLLGVAPTVRRRRSQTPRRPPSPRLGCLSLLPPAATALRGRQYGDGARSSILVCSGLPMALYTDLGRWWEGVAGVPPPSLASAPAPPESLVVGNGAEYISTLENM